MRFCPTLLATLLAGVVWVATVSAGAKRLSSTTVTLTEPQPVRRQ